MCEIQWIKMHGETVQFKLPLLRVIYVSYYSSYLHLQLFYEAMSTDQTKWHT